MKKNKETEVLEKSLELLTEMLSKITPEELKEEMKKYQSDDDKSMSVLDFLKLHNPKIIKKD